MAVDTLTDPGTLRQYAERERARYCADEPTVSRAEHRRWYPVESYTEEWVKAVFDVARGGGVLSRVTLDCLWGLENGRVWWALYHDYPRSIPTGYLNPSARKAQQAKGA